MALATTSELLAYLKDEAGDTATNATTDSKYIALLDRAHRTIVGGGGELNVDSKGLPVDYPYIFSWAVEDTPITVNVEAPYNTGTMAVTAGSTSATLSADPSKDFDGWFVKIAGDSVVYRVTNTSTGASFTLDSQYLGTTNAAAEYTLFRLDYTFEPASGSLLLPADRLRISTFNDWIQLTSRSTLDDKFPLNKVQKSIPHAAGILRQTTDGFKVRLSHYPPTAERLDMYYVKVPETLDTVSVDPILPKHHRIVVPHLALFYLLRRYDDDRAQSHLQTAVNLFRSLKNESGHFLDTYDDMYGVVSPWY